MQLRVAQLTPAECPEGGGVWVGWVMDMKGMVDEQNGFLFFWAAFAGGSMELIDFCRTVLD